MRAVLVSFVILGSSLAFADVPGDYRSPATAQTVAVKSAAGPGAGQPAFLGVRLAADASGRPIVAELYPDSPAARAGIRVGDVVRAVGGRRVERLDTARALLLARAPGEDLDIGVLRGERTFSLKATLAATSRPKTLAGNRIELGARLGQPREDDGVPVEQVLPRTPAAAAGLRAGDHILMVNGTALTGAGRLNDFVSESRPGDTLTLMLRRDGKKVELKVPLLGSEGSQGRRRGAGGQGQAPNAGPPPLFKGSVFRLALVPVEFPESKHNPKISSQEWRDLLFSTKTYAGKNNATGQPVHGSLNDYFREQSYCNFRVEGKVFDWVEVGKKRAEYARGSGTGPAARNALLGEALDKLLARDGKEALRDFDGLFFLYAGERVQANRGNLYSPHQGTFFHQGKRWKYLLAAEGGTRMTNLSGCCREFAFVLGLPDLAARPENPGSEGLGIWCLLSNPTGDGRPQHLSAWAKEAMGWLRPAAIDPTVKQKLALGPVEDSPDECFKMLVRPDGTEYFLLENRQKKGFDQGLPAEGLLIWRVINNRPVLEESHGVEGPLGPRVFLSAVPYPSPANNAFTPDTTPSSRSPRGGGLPVHVTEIRRLANGRVGFQVGYVFE